MQDIAVLSARKTTPGTIEQMVEFAHQAGLQQIDIMSDAPSTSHALQASCPHDWPWQQLRDEADKHQIDVNKLPAEGRRKKLMLADMDATIIRGESLDELAELAGIAEQIKPITARAMAGELDFNEALAARLALLAGQPQTLLDDVINNTVITDGAREAVATMRAHGSSCYLVSGGFTFLTGVIAKTLGFNGHHSNIMDVADGKLTGRAVPPILGKQAKLAFLQKYIADYGLRPDDTLCVGDGANDMAMLDHAGLGVAFEGKPALREQINIQLNHTDLTGLLYLQGYHSAEFATI